jgi:PAS domain S-box-containing protein
MQASARGTIKEIIFSERNMLRRLSPLQAVASEQTDVSSALKTMTWTIMAAAPLVLAGFLELSAYSWRWLAIVTCVYALCSTVLLLNSSGRTRPAGILLAVGMWVLATALALTGGGIAAIASNFYPALVLVVGLLFGARAGAFTAVVVILTSFGLVILERGGWLHWGPLPYTPFFRWVLLTILTVIVTGLQYLTWRTTGEALRQSREELRERRRAETLMRESEETLRSWERRFSIAFNANPAPSTISTLDGRFLAANSQFLRTTGYTREEVIGKTAIELKMWPNPDNRRRVMEKLKEEGKVRGYEVDLRTKTGENRVLLLSVEQIELDGQPCLLHSAQDITERTRAEMAVRASEERLRALSARLRSAREEEGKRIAREIHDELGGALTGLKWELEGIAEHLHESANSPGFQAIRDRISRMTHLIDTTITAVRRISADLRPSILDDLGLIAAIEWQAQQFQLRTGIRCDSETASDALDLDRDRATAVFRIFQEILTNVLRHASATHVSVQIRMESGTFVLEVQDNGRGITDQDKASAESLGLLGMRERAALVGGEIIIRSAEGQGTNVVVRVPVTV